MNGSPQSLQRAHFDKWAKNKDKSYDDFLNMPHRRATDELLIPYIKKQLEKGAWILDAGCGSGGFALEMAKSGYNVVGIDISREMLLIAAGKAESMGLSDRVLFMVGDAENLPAGDTLWDCVSTIGVLHHLSSPENCCRKIQNALKPGGIHFFTENNKTVLRPVFDFMMRIWPLWNEEAGENETISKEMVEKWCGDGCCVEDCFYSMFVPPHLPNILGARAGKAVVSATDSIFKSVPGIRSLGGLIHGIARKNAV